LQRQLGETRRLSSLGKLAATMAHEFNNVLMGIGTFTEVLRRRTAGEVHVQNAVSQIQQSLGRGRRITDEILRFTREPTPVVATIDVRRWLTDFLPEAAALTGGRAELDVADDLFIRGDMALLNQALANLVINARDAAPAGPIRIVTRGTGDDRLDLMVADSGGGIAPEIRERIFEPLFTTKKSGTGLGLAVVHQVVSAQGGTIDVESEVGRGTEFHLRFPLVAADDDESSGRGVSHVLLVEDDPAVTLALHAVLEAEEIAVRSVTNGKAAIAAIARQIPDVVLLDIGLPDVSGVDVYNEIAMRWPQLPVTFITAELDDTAVAGFLRLPHVGFLRKPFEAEQLLGTLSRITAIKRSHPGRKSNPGRNPGIRRSK
jgi:CheY-like chemotaxis protein